VNSHPGLKRQASDGANLIAHAVRATGNVEPDGGGDQLEVVGA
jgi:hypothetical protein